MVFLVSVNGRKVFSTRSSQEFEKYCRGRYEQFRLCDQHTIVYECLSEVDYSSRFEPLPLPEDVIKSTKG